MLNGEVNVDWEPQPGEIVQASHPACKGSALVLATHVHGNDFSCLVLVSARCMPMNVSSLWLWSAERWAAKGRSEWNKMRSRR